MASISVVFFICVALIFGRASVNAVPVESSSAELVDSGAIPANATTITTNSNSAINAANVTDVQTQTQTQAQESHAAMPQQQANGNFVGAVDSELPDQVAAASHYDPSIYSGLYSPDAFQQYVNHFGGPYGPYAAAAYPAPVGYAPPAPAYHSPYSVQTGYEGYLVPSSDDSTSSSSTTTNTAIDVSSPSALSSLLNPLTLLGSLFPALMMSTLFRVITAIVSMIGMVLFGGAITTAICNLTPICDISFKAVTYLRRRGTAQRVSRMIADEMTPERVRRATEFVQNAIRKYRDMQRFESVAMSDE